MQDNITLINRINAETESVNRISLVSTPANETNIHTCGADFCHIDNDNHSFTAPVLYPNQKIWRDNPERFIYFTKDGIERLAHRFITNVNNKQLSLEHENKLSDNLDLVESFVTKAKLNEHPIGAWLVSIKVNDDNLWNDISKGKYNGLSLEMIAEEEVILSISEKDTEEDLLRKAKELDSIYREEIFSEFKQ